MINKFKHEIPQAQKDYEFNFFSTIDRHFGVLCFSQVWDSVLMWSHYSDNHSGFCIGFYFDKMSNEIKSGSLGPVRYDQFPNINPLETDKMETAIIQSYFKAPGWSYEKEFRMIRLEYPKELVNEQRFHTYENTSLKEILLGMTIDENDKREIIKIAVARCIPVYQIEKVPLSFDITRRQLTEEEMKVYQ